MTTNTNNTFFIENIELLYPFFNTIKEYICIISENDRFDFVNSSLLSFLNVSNQELDKLFPSQLFPELNSSVILKNQLKLIHPETKNEVKFCINYIERQPTKTILQFSTGQQEVIKAPHDGKLLTCILNSSELMFIFVDQEGRVQAFNQPALKFYQHIFNETICLGEMAENFIKDEDIRKIFKENFQKAVGGTGQQIEQTILDEQTHSHHFEYAYNPVYDTENIIGVSIFIKNITQTVNFREQLKRSESLFRNMFENIEDPAAIWQLDSSGCFILKHFNKATEKFTNNKISKYLGKSIEEFYTSNPDLIQHYYKTLQKGANLRVEMPYQMVTTGKEIWIIADYIKIAEDTVLNIFSNITDRKLMELETVEKERQLQTFLGNLPGMVYRCLNDKDWTMIFVSEGCYNLTGYEPLDLIKNQKITYNDLVHIEDQQRIWDEIQSALQKKQKYEIIYRIHTAQKTVKWVWERGQGIFDEKGQILYLEGFITDISSRIQSEHEAKKAQQQAEALREALTEITTQLSLSEVLRKILDSLKKVLDYDSATLFLKLDGQVKIVAARGFENTGKLINRAFPSNHLLIQEIDRHQKPLILHDVSQDERFQAWVTETTNTWMGIPLIRNQNTIGYLTLDNNNPNGYNQEDAEIAQLFANGAAVVIENAKLYEKSQTLATSDALTSIYNRRYFYELALTEFDRCKRYGTPLSIVMLDIDHFKYINDKYGHQSGDQLLVKFVKRVKQSLRTSDIFARYGGEEFIILLPETENQQAVQAAERIRVETAEKSFNIQKVNPYITISLGVATLDASCETLDTLIDRSDKALYEAKQIGRNRVRSWNR